MIFQRTTHTFYKHLLNLIIDMKSCSTFIIQFDFQQQISI